MGSDVDKPSRGPLGVDGKKTSFSGTINRPVKQMRLEDGKGSSFSAGGLSASVDTNGSGQLGVASDPRLAPNSEKPTAMVCDLLHYQ